MEGIVKKYQQKFKKIKEEMNRWDELQSRLISQFRNTSSIIERLQIIQDSKNYGSLNSVDGIEEVVFQKQMESLQMILLSLQKTLEQFRGIVSSLEKMHRDGKQLVKGGSNQLTVKQLQQSIGVKPCLADCLDGLMILHDMHNSEYALKVSLVSALSTLAVRPITPSTSDLGSLQQLLVDQPNIPKEEGGIFQCNTSLKSSFQKRSVDFVLNSRSQPFVYLLLFGRVLELPSAHKGMSVKDLCKLMLSEYQNLQNFHASEDNDAVEWLHLLPFDLVALIIYHASVLKLRFNHYEFFPPFGVV